MGSELWTRGNRTQNVAKLEKSLFKALLFQVLSRKLLNSARFLLIRRFLFFGSEKRVLLRWQPFKEAPLPLSERNFVRIALAYKYSRCRIMFLAIAPYRPL